MARLLHPTIQLQHIMDLLDELDLFTLLSKLILKQTSSGESDTKLEHSMERDLNIG